MKKDQKSLKCQAMYEKSVRRILKELVSACRDTAVKEAKCCEQMGNTVVGGS